MIPLGLSELFRDCCVICERLADSKLTLGNHTFCNYGCQALYMSRVPKESRWFFDLAWEYKEREFQVSKIVERIASGVTIKVRWI